MNHSERTTPTQCRGERISTGLKKKRKESQTHVSNVLITLEMPLSGFFSYRNLYRDDFIDSKSSNDSTTNSKSLLRTSTTKEKILGVKSTLSLDMISFTYFYWPLVVLAIFLILTLIFLFVYYCRAVIKDYRTRR